MKPRQRLSADSTPESQGNIIMCERRARTRIEICWCTDKEWFKYCSVGVRCRMCVEIEQTDLGLALEYIDFGNTGADRKLVRIKSTVQSQVICIEMKFGQTTNEYSF